MWRFFMTGFLILDVRRGSDEPIHEHSRRVKLDLLLKDTTAIYTEPPYPLVRFDFGQVTHADHRVAHCIKTFIYGRVACIRRNFFGSAPIATLAFTVRMFPTSLRISSVMPEAFHVLRSPDHCGVSVTSEAARLRV